MAHEEPGFWARYHEMERVCGPPSWPTLFASRARIDAALSIVKRANAGDSVDTAQLAEAKALVSATLHPDTLEPIPHLFRMAAHVPVNTVLLLGMLTAATPATVGLWQFLNQSFNAAQFYANRNQSLGASDSPVRLAAAYTGAVAASVGVGVGLKALCVRALAQPSAIPTDPSSARRLAMSRAVARVVDTAVPFAAAAAGKPLQIGLMRSEELTAGVAVYDEDGRYLGISRICGRLGVAMTVCIRTLYLTPMLVLPLIMRRLVATVPVLQHSALAYNLSYALMCGAASAYATPLCMAVFPHTRACVHTHTAEDAFHSLTRANGEPVRHLYFNKGL